MTAPTTSPSTASTASTAPTAPPARTAAAALLTSAVLLAISSLTQPDVTGGAAQKLAAIDDAGGRAVVCAVLFAVAQLPFAVALVAVGNRLRPRAPRLAATGTTLAVLGAFGHALFGGVSLTYLLMASDTANRAVYAQLVSDIESSPVMLTSLVGLAGTVLGLLLLSIALFRSGVGPRWVGPVLWVFLVVEFVGTSMSRYASFVSAVLLVLAFGALARTMLAPATVSGGR
jgi:hypothetical protein